MVPLKIAVVPAQFVSAVLLAAVALLVALVLPVMTVARLVGPRFPQTRQLIPQASLALTSLALCPPALALPAEFAWAPAKTP